MELKELHTWILFSKNISIPVQSFQRAIQHKPLTSHSLIWGLFPFSNQGSITRAVVTLSVKNFVTCDNSLRDDSNPTKTAYYHHSDHLDNYFYDSEKLILVVAQVDDFQVLIVKLKVEIVKPLITHRGKIVNFTKPNFTWEAGV